MSEVLHLDESNFESAIEGKVALVDFWAEWCGPCRMLGPILEEVAKEVGDKAVVAKVDVDKANNLAQKFLVRSIPAIFIIKDGNIVEQFVGVQDKNVLVNAINNAL
jgi:thioredoxin 1